MAFVKGITPAFLTCEILETKSSANILGYCVQRTTEEISPIAPKNARGLALHIRGEARVLAHKVAAIYAHHLQ